MARGVPPPLSWPNVVGLVRLRLGLLGCMWFSTLVTCQKNCAPTRSFQIAMSLTTLASRFHVGRPRRPPPQRLSSPSTQGRNSSQIAAGLVNPAQAVVA